jgi:alpha-ketoglutaric semialdehyde dehydrogenase
MLTAGIHNSYVRSTESRNSRADMKLLAVGISSGQAGSAVPALYSVNAKVFQSDPSLHDEVFGPCSLVIWCDCIDEMKTLLAGLDGNLTATLHASSEEMSSVAPDLVPLLQSNAGRIIINGFPTGVEAVSHSIVRSMPSFDFICNPSAGTWWPLSRSIRRQDNFCWFACNSSFCSTCVLPKFSRLTSS